MQAQDYRGGEITGTNGHALEHFEQALAAFQDWRGDPFALAAKALEHAPAFVMAHVLQACILMCGREPAAIDAARQICRRARALPANERERLHLSAIAAVLADDYERARSIYGTLLARDPLDVLALQVVHALDYLYGDGASLGLRVARVLPAWSPGVPGYKAVLSMYAFGLEESGEFERAEATAERVLEIDALNARAHHTLAHVFEMTGRIDDGLRWVQARASSWAVGSTVSTHCWWHAALFHISASRNDRALLLYDQRIRATPSPAISDMIDASALLWRVMLRGGDVGTRANDLAPSWTPRVADGFCTFTDMHAMMAFAIAGDRAHAELLLAGLAQQQSANTRYGEMSRIVGLPACRALLAFARGDCVNAVSLLGTLPGIAQRLGGSHAQRDVLHLTLMEAVERIRGRRRQLSVAA